MLPTLANMQALLQFDPGWLSDPKSQQWRRAVLAQKDASLDRLKRAIKMRLATLAPADAQDAIAWETQFERSASDTNASFGARLAARWQIWQWSGRAIGLLRALEAAGYTNVFLAIARSRAYWLRQYVLFSRGSLASTAVFSVTGTSAPQQPHMVDVHVTDVASFVTFRLSVDGIFISGGRTSSAAYDLGVLDARLAGVTFTITGAAAAEDRFHFAVGPDLGGFGLATDNLPARSWACDATLPAFWSKFVVFFPSDPWYPESPAYNDARIDQVRRLVKRWKPGLATCADIAALVAGRSWDYPWTDRTWDGQGGTWSGSNVLHYEP